MPNALWLITKIWKSQTTWKNKTKTIKMINLLVKNWKPSVWRSFFIFFMQFARFQILKCKLQSIWRKLLVLSSLYLLDIFTESSNVFAKFLERRSRLVGQLVFRFQKALIARTKGQRKRLLAFPSYNGSKKFL